MYLMSCFFEQLKSYKYEYLKMYMSLLVISYKVISTKHGKVDLIYFFF